MSNYCARDTISLEFVNSFTGVYSEDNFNVVINGGGDWV